MSIENDDPRVETGRKGDEVIQRTQDTADVEMNRIDGSQVERCVGPRSGPGHASFVDIDYYSTALGSVAMGASLSLHLTTAVSSPGKTRNRSPT